MEAKENKHSRTNYVVAIGAGLLLAAIIGFIVFKVQKSLKSPDTITETIDTTIEKEQHRTDTIKLKAPAPDSAKLLVLFARYFKKDSIPSKYPKFLTEAFIGYNFGDYLYFKQLDFDALPETLETIEDSNRETILQLGHYYKGIVGIVINDSIQAKTNLQWSINHASHEMSIKAKWFLALTYIKLMQPDRADGLLKLVATSNTAGYNKQAKQLLEDLEKK